MWKDPFPYHPIATQADQTDTCEVQPRWYHKLSWRTYLLGTGTLAILLAFWHFFSTTHVCLPNKCQQANARHEWRSLSVDEQQEYIRAVGCLRNKPSKIGMNHSLYDDFPWVHSQVGGYAHQSAAFLPWHRYFIHVYEKTLQQECSYAGTLPYWNWILDWKDLTKAPVWSNETFGGNGNSDLDGQGDILFNGHCVSDGPFAFLQVLYLKGQSSPHCLSRGFESGAKLSDISSWIRPTAIETLLAGDRYNDFNLGLENAAHNTIPRSIRGDFLLHTAPYDPLFFLHHAQLDRIWASWQLRAPSDRQKQYEGPAAHESGEQAALTDILPMGGLAADIPVSEVLCTRGSLLCYLY